MTQLGTHEKRGRLPARVNEYYSLNREGSVFRKHVGGALMKRNGEPASEIRAWYRARRSPRFNDPKLRQYEALVHQEASRGRYRVLKVEDAHERLELEEKLIALFSHCHHCGPSSEWLGNWAYPSEICKSGVWNVRHVCSENEFQTGDVPRL